MPAQRLVASLMACCLLSLPADGQTRSGGFSGTVGGQPQNWHVLSVENIASAGWSDVDGTILVEVLGYPRADSTDDRVGAVEFSFHLDGPGFLPREARMTYFAGGMRRVYGHGETERPRVSIDSVLPIGDRLRIRGEVAGDLFAFGTLSGGDLDRQDRLAVTARFDLTLDPR